MKNILDQISIPSLCRGLSELACTLVEKQWCCVCDIVGSNPATDNVEELQHGLEHKGKLSPPFFLLCGALILSPFLGTPENTGVTQQFHPLLGPREGRGHAATDSGILNNPVRRRVVCRSQRTSARQHKKSLVSGTVGAFRLCSDKRLDPLENSIFWARKNFHRNFFSHPPPPLGVPPEKKMPPWYQEFFSSGPWDLSDVWPPGDAECMVDTPEALQKAANCQSPLRGACRCRLGRVEESWSYYLQC